MTQMQQATHNPQSRSRQPAVATPPFLPLYSYLSGNEDVRGKLIVDLFAGGGGVSSGIEDALARSPDIAINHDDAALFIHQINHPYTRHFQSDIFEVDPLEATGGKKVALIWASPDCSHFSSAKGGGPLDQNIRSLPWVVLKWAGKTQPDCIIVENVTEIQSWSRLIPDRSHIILENGRHRKLSSAEIDWPNRPKRAGTACRGYRTPEQRRTAALTAGLPARTRLAPWKMPRQNPPRGPVRLDEHGRPLMVADQRGRYRGRTFKRFVRELRRLGYEVEYRTLKAHLYGVPTVRERFFLIARRDGKPIVWPEETHGPGRLPVRTAAECIDWTLPTRSIFETHAKRSVPLASRTFRRIARGVARYVLGEDEPFIVQGPAPVQAPYLVHLAHGGHDCRQRSARLPLSTVTAGDRPFLASPFLTPMNFDNVAAPVTAPLPTVTTQGNRNTLITPFLAPCYSERSGQKPRCGSINQPLPTVTTGANGARMVAAHLTSYQQRGVSLSPDSPADTIRAEEKSNHPGELHRGGIDPDLLPQARRVYAFMETHCPEALDTLSPESRAQRLVTVNIAGEQMVLFTIGLRTISPRELFTCSGFSESYVIEPDYHGKPLAKHVQNRLVGNSVPPPLVAALVRAQFPGITAVAAD